MNLILLSAMYAQEKHEGQLRKWTARPYIEHPMRVAGRVCLSLPMADLVGEYAVAAAWLHDVIEDCATSADRLIRDGFPKPVVDVVEELTKPDKATQPGMNREARCKAYMERLKTASRAAKVIKLCDRIDNLSEMSGAPVNFLWTYARESKELLTTLQGTDRRLENELASLIAQIDATRN